jgi:hypothetical protein
LHNAEPLQKSSAGTTFVVDVAAGTCSCGKPQTLGEICRHAVVAYEHAAAPELVHRRILGFFAIGMRTTDARVAYDASRFEDARAQALRPWSGLAPTPGIVPVRSPASWPKRRRKRSASRVPVKQICVMEVLLLLLFFFFFFFFFFYF